MIALDSATYEQLIEAAIDRERDVIGEEAIERARTIEGLTLDDEGTVGALDREGKVVLGELVDEYIAASGDVAAFLIARRIENLPHDELELPPNLGGHL